MDITMETLKRGRRFKQPKSKLTSWVLREVSSLESFTNLYLSLNPQLHVALRSLEELPLPHSPQRTSPTPSGTT